jgi:hypothetical protein
MRKVFEVSTIVSPLEMIFYEGNYPFTVGIKYPSGRIDRRFGDGPRHYLTPPKDIDMRVPDDIRKSVLFIGTLEDPDNPKWRATGYFVAAPGVMIKKTEELEYREKRYIGTSSYPFRFLVTAAHVAEKLEGEEFALRVNKKRGGVEIIKGNADTKWWYHPTDKEHVDAAVTMFLPEDIEGLDLFTVHLDLFADEQKIKELHIGAGDEVFIAGLFTKITKTAQNVPIIRIGNLAMMPGERIPFKDGNLFDAYLIESRSIGGLSGAPVFVRQTIKMIGHTASGRFFDSDNQQLPPNDLIALDAVGGIYFLGSVIGHWDAPTGLNVSEPETVNMGISPIVPAQKIREIITQPELIEMAKKVSDEMAVKENKHAVYDIEQDEKEPFTREDFENALKKASRKLSDGK